MAVRPISTVSCVLSRGVTDSKVCIKQRYRSHWCRCGDLNAYRCPGLFICVGPLSVTLHYRLIESETISLGRYH